MAAMHNIDINKGGEQGTAIQTQPGQKSIFGSPKDYAHLSMEERKRLTQQMKTKLKGTMKEVLTAKKGTSQPR